MYWMKKILTHIKPQLSKTANTQKQLIQHLSSSEVSVALRPFYFAVHPDLFGQYPQERDINENSLKQLNNYIETLLHQKPIRPARVKFYLRKQNPKECPFEAVNISLVQKDIRCALQGILSSCKLSTQYVDNLPKLSAQPLKVKQHGLSQVHSWAATTDWEDTLRKKTESKSEDITLGNWVTKNSGLAEERSKSYWPVREEISRLQNGLCQELKLKDLVWDCGWGTSHFRGCLQSFQTLVTHHSLEMQALNGRTVIFGNESGISLQGHVILNSGEVRNNWLDLIRNLQRYEVHMKRIPALEAALSRSLSEIRVAQRRFRPELLAEAYESHLRTLTTSLGDYRGRHEFPKSWPESLANFELVVEGEAGPLMLSPSGQFIAPASCPIFLLVSFISANLDEARARLDQHVKALEHEKVMIARCMDLFGLTALGKDDNVTPSQMATCCSQLLKQEDFLKPKFNKARIWVTHYYSLLTDGEMCIPWNWK